MLLTDRLLKTLSHRINKEIRRSLYQNKVFLKSRWNFLEEGFVLWSTNYKKHILLTLILALLVMVNMLLWRPILELYIDRHIPYWAKLLEWQGVLLAGQLTIIGVLYPLAVGFVSLLFQDKSAKKTIIPIYQKYSGLMFSGLSGFALSLFIIIGYFISGSPFNAVYLSLCLTSVIWFASNILLSVWFFVSTFQMLDETRRERLFVRFSVHESCEQSVREGIKKILIENSVDQGLLINPEENILKVTTLCLSDDGYNEVQRTVEREAIIENIQYRLINIAIRLQIVFLKRSGVEGGRISIGLPRPSKSGEGIIVARYSGFTLNPLVHLLIRSAFSFKRPKDQKQLGVPALVQGVVGAANDAIREGNTDDFSDALASIVNWHIEVAQALSFKNDSGEQDNWLYLPSGNTFASSHLQVLLRRYHELARDAVEKVPENSRFYHEMLFLHRRIFSRYGSLIKEEIKPLIQGSYHMWVLLMEWRSYSSQSGDMRIANKYENILYGFVGAWERWLVDIEPRSKRPRDIEKSYPALITHLELTASTTIVALRFNNYEAAGWGVDMLNNWLRHISLDEHWEEVYSWRSVLLNHKCLLKNPDDPDWQQILKGHNYEHLAAFHLSFKNASLDLRVLTACYILMKPDQDKREELAGYVKALLSGESIHDTGGIDRPGDTVRTAGDLLGAYIRHQDYCHNGGETYKDWLSSILSSFGQIYEERLVPGRIYWGWVANDPSSMNKTYVEIAIFLSQEKWRLTSGWEEAILSDAFSHDDRESIISDLKDWLKISEEDCSGILISPGKDDELVKNFHESVTTIIGKIRDAQSDAVIGADVVQEILDNFGMAASEIFMNLEESAFPLSLFEHRYPNQKIDDDHSYVVNVLDYPKARIASGIEVNGVGDESEPFSSHISNDVKMNILRHLLEYPISASCKYQNTDDALYYIKNKVESLAHPILFVGSKKLSRFLRRSPYERAISDRYGIYRQDGLGRKYICHIGCCEVYSLNFSDVDYCILTTRELFDSVGFRLISERQYLMVEFIPNPEDGSTGKLQFRYWMDIQLTEHTDCIRIDIQDSEE